MPNSSEPMSAFAVYSMKRKNLEVLQNSKKLKKKHVSFEKDVIQNTGQKKSKQTPVKKGANGATQVVLNNSFAKKKIIPVPVNNVSIISKKKKAKQQKQTKNTDITKVTTAQNSNRQNLDALTNSAPKAKREVPKPIQIKIKKGKGKNTMKKLNAKSSTSIVPLLSLNHNVIGDSADENPLTSSRSMFEWLIHPLKLDDFFKQNWEKTPVHVKRDRPSYYKFLMSTPLLDKILRDDYILFTKNIDITSYTNGVRETHNPVGRAVPSVVWDYYVNGCSVRMLNPQTYIPKLHALNATLQEFFGCFVGANSYLTPPNSQGFAPHYDDIEAFILQIEGKKRWRLYKPRNESEYLSRFSSKNFDQSEIGEPIMDTIVNAGDLLYFPRGTIHQGETIGDTHSLHITLSVYQRNCWGDFLEKLLPEALKSAIESDSEFREGLPLDYLKYSGLVHSENDSKARKSFEEKVKGLLGKLLKHIDVDKAADSMGKGHVHDFLPPFLSEGEQECSVVQDGEQMTANGVVENRVEIEPDTKIRLLRSHCVRLVEEDDTFKVYYSCENSKEYHEYEPQYLEVSKEFVPAIREIIVRYPEFIRVEDLPIEGEDNKIQIAKDLWEKCIVITEHPLCVID